MVPLIVDFPHSKRQSDELKEQNDQLMIEYGVQGFPTVVAIKATAICLATGQCIYSGSEVGSVVGYSQGFGPDNWIASFSTAAGIK
jgi:hypothetical protein